MLPLDKAIGVEPNLTKIYKLDYNRVDTSIQKQKYQNIVVSPDTFELFNNIRLQRNAKYGVIIAIDDSKSFGIQKLLSIKPNLLFNATGFDISLTEGKNIVELSNEIKSISSYLKNSGVEYKIRWSILVNKGIKHIDNCLGAIKNCPDIKYDMIKLIGNTDASLNIMLSLVNECRKTLGDEKARFKINGKFDELVAEVRKNIYYDIDINNLL